MAQTAEPDNFEFEGTATLYAPTGSVSNPNQQNDGYTLSLQGSFTDPTVWFNGSSTPPYNPGFGNYSPTAPSANSAVLITDNNEVTQSPTVVEPGGFCGYTNTSFNVSGVSGQIEDLLVTGSGTISLGSLNVTGFTPTLNQTSGVTTFVSIGGFPTFYQPANGVAISTGYGASTQTINGGTLTTPTLSLQVGTSLSNGGSGPAPDPVADAGSITFNSVTLNTGITRLADDFGGTTPIQLGTVTLNNSDLFATTELDIVGVNEQLFPTVTGTPKLKLNDSTITAGAVVIATGDGLTAAGTYTTGYGSGMVHATAEIDLTNGSDLDAAQGGMTPPSLVVGDTGDGTLNASGNSSITSIQAVLGNAAGSTGTVLLDGSDWTNSSYLSIGSMGSGKLTVTNNSDLESDDIMYIGLYAGSTGNVIISNGGSIVTATTGVQGTNSTVLGQSAMSSGTLTITGDGSELESKGDMGIGYSGNGTVMISDGGSLIVDGTLLRVGRNAGSVGMLTVTGDDSTVSGAMSTLYVGYGGMGTVTVEESGRIEVMAANVGGLSTGNGEFDIVGVGSQVTLDGDLTDGDAGMGEVQVSQQGSLSVAKLIIGNAATGNGQLTIFDGGQMTTSDDATIGATAGSTGNIDIHGTDTELNMHGALTVGVGGTGSLGITGGATVMNTEATVGANAASTGSVQVSDSGSLWNSSGDLTIGESGTGTVTVDTGGTIQVGGELSIAKNAGSVGTLTIDGSSSTFTYSSNQEVTIGGSGRGTMNVQNGAFVDLSGNDVTVGDGENFQATGTGTLLVTGSSTILNTGGLTIGGKGDGEMNVMNGATVSSGDGSIGDEENSTGDVTVSGAGSSWSASDLTVGGGGDGMLEIENGGTVNIHSTELAIGDEVSGTGTLVLDGAGSSLIFQGELQVGEEGTGFFTVHDGGSFTGHAINIGDQANSTGTMIVDGAGTSVEVQTDFNIGEQGTGTLNVTNGAKLLSDGDAAVADLTASVGVVTVDQGASWTVGNSLTVGGQGEGTVTISNGSIVTAHAITEGDLAAGIGEIDVTGDSSSPSTLHYTESMTVGNAGQGILNVTAGGLVSPTSGGVGEVDIAAMASGRGNVTVSGHDASSGSELNANVLAVGGTAKVAGGTANLSVSDGGIVKVTSKLQMWSGGTVDVRSGGSVTVGSGATAAAGTIQVNDTGTLGGGGNIIGDVVNEGGTVAPGDPQTLHIAGSYTQTGGILDLEIAGTAPGNFDQIVATDTISVTDAVIDLSFTEGFAPKAGDVFDLLVANGGDTSGVVDLNDVTFHVEGLDSGFEYQTTIDPTSDTLELSALNNGVAAVPEPSTWILVFCGIAGLFGFYLNRRKSDFRSECADLTS